MFIFGTKQYARILFSYAREQRSKNKSIKSFNICKINNKISKPIVENNI